MKNDPGTSPLATAAKREVPGFDLLTWQSKIGIAVHTNSGDGIWIQFGKRMGQCPDFRIWREICARMC